VTALAAAAAAAVLAIGAILVYNGLVRARLQVREAWAAVDVQLQRRASLVPSLVATVKGYAAYERDTLTRVAAARSALAAAAGPREAARADLDLSGSLHALLAVAEAYPDLEANEVFLQLQRDLQDTENKIAYARSYYNGAVETYNIRIERFPAVLIAAALGFRPAEFFSAEESARQPVAVDSPAP